MPEIRNTSKGDLTLGNGITIVKGKSVNVPADVLEREMKSPVVQAWFKDGKLSKAGAKAEAEDDGGHTVADVLSMAEDGTHFQTFKAAAADILGDDTPATKDEIVAALKAKQS